MASAKDWLGEVQKLGGHSFEGVWVLACHGGLSADGASFLYELRMGLWQVLSVGGEKSATERRVAPHG